MANNKLEDAINAFKSGMSCYAAAIKFDIPRSTLRRKIKEAGVTKSEPAKPEMKAAMSAEMLSFMSVLTDMVHKAAKPAKKAKAPPSKRKAKSEDENAPALPISGGTHEKPEDRIQLLLGRNFIITSAQNNTDLHDGFWRAMDTFCADVSALRLVSTFGYNKKGWSQPHRITKSDKSLWYAPEIKPYLCNVPSQLAPGLLLCGQAEISPTAENPLSGFEDFSRACSGIFPHTKHAVLPMPSLKGKPERKLYTTGACTLPNYIPRKVGQKAEFNHIIGALIVQVADDGTWFVWQVNANADGSFQHLDKIYHPDGRITEGKVAAVTWGDWHIEKEDEEITEVCLGEGGILDTLKPLEQHHHDLLDFTGRNHHSLKDRYFLADMAWKKTDLVEDGIIKCARLLEMADRPWSKQVLMVSNHCSAFEKWLKEAEGYLDPNPDNVIYWLEWNKQKLLSIKHGNDNFDVFEQAVRQHTDVEKVRWLRQDESYVICEDQGGGIECSQHGHQGVNGARGTPRGYRGLGIRLNTAHTHSAGIYGGIYVAGVNGKKEMGYNLGAGSWSHTQIITYANGKRTLLDIKNGKWRAEPAASPVVEKPRFRVQALSQAA